MRVTVLCVLFGMPVPVKWDEGNCDVFIIWDARTCKMG
jgi:hypothetical protein